MAPLTTTKRRIKKQSETDKKKRNKILTFLECKTMEQFTFVMDYLLPNSLEVELP